MRQGAYLVFLDTLSAVLLKSLVRLLFARPDILIVLISGGGQKGRVPSSRYPCNGMSFGQSAVTVARASVSKRMLHLLG
jgi:hypothetical protein